nr:hypothetical protein [Tanacetum cinerariifolium]
DKISDSTLSELDEPANYKEAMASPKAAKWKTVGRKWIFKKTTYMDRKVHTYKARDRLKCLIGLSQDTCLDKILKRFRMENSKKRNLPLHHGIKISKDLCTKIDEELDRMSRVPYASTVGSIMSLDSCKEYSYLLRNTKDRFLVYGGEEELRGAVTWKSSKQDTVIDSTCESEYIAACEASKEAI